MTEFTDDEISKVVSSKDEEFSASFMEIDVKSKGYVYRKQLKEYWKEKGLNMDLFQELGDKFDLKGTFKDKKIYPDGKISLI